jgi:hypothetical protein
MRGLTLRSAARRVGGVIAMLALAGCATLSEQECRSGDWDAVGREDGAAGAKADQFERHRKACARHAIEPQEAAWRAGYARGLEEFCTPKGGYLAGRDGRGHKELCVGKPQETAFLQALRRGREIDALRKDLDELRRRARDLEVAVLSGEYNDYDTTQARMRIGQLDGELRSREWELERLDADYAAEYGAPRLKDSALR